MNGAVIVSISNTSGHYRGCRTARTMVERRPGAGVDPGPLMRSVGSSTRALRTAPRSPRWRDGYDLNANQLFTWRRQFGVEPAEPKELAPILPVTITPETAAEYSGPRVDRPDGDRARRRRSDHRVGGRRDGGADACPEGAVAAMIPIPSGRSGMDRDGPHRHAARHAGSGASGSGAVEARSSCGRSLHLPRTPRRSRQNPLARRDRSVALRQAARPRKVHLAVGDGGRGVDFGGADGLYARRDRLAKSATDVATQSAATAPGIERGEKMWGCVHFGAPQITRFVIHFVSWTPRAKPLLDENAALKAELAVARAKASEDMALIARRSCGSPSCSVRSTGRSRSARRG